VLPRWSPLRLLVMHPSEDDSTRMGRLTSVVSVKLGVCVHPPRTSWVVRPTPRHQQQRSPASAGTPSTARAVAPWPTRPTPSDRRPAGRPGESPRPADLEGPPHPGPTRPHPARSIRRMVPGSPLLARFGPILLGTWAGRASGRSRTQRRLPIGSRAPSSCRRCRWRGRFLWDRSLPNTQRPGARGASRKRWAKRCLNPRGARIVVLPRPGCQAASPTRR
jgi:hypothetical protein